MVCHSGRGKRRIYAEGEGGLGDTVMCAGVSDGSG